MHETIRGRLGINDNQKKLVDIVNTQKQFSKIFDPLVNKKIVLAYDSILSDSGEIIRGYFRGGPFKKIEFYVTKQNPNGFDGLIWFSSGGYAIGLDKIYDVEVIDESDKEDLSNLADNDLKIFRFEANAGSEEEKAHVIHKDVFSAYNSLLERGQIRSREQVLKEVSRITPGFSIYEYASHRE